VGAADAGCRMQDARCKMQVVVVVAAAAMVVERRAAKSEYE
jgi:hypothetical protein